MSRCYAEPRGALKARCARRRARSRRIGSRSLRGAPRAATCGKGGPPGRGAREVLRGERAPSDDERRGHRRRGEEFPRDRLGDPRRAHRAAERFDLRQRRAGRCGRERAVGSREPVAHRSERGVPFAARRVEPVGRACPPEAVAEAEPQVRGARVCRRRASRRCLGRERPSGDDGLRCDRLGAGGRLGLGGRRRGLRSSAAAAVGDEDDGSRQPGAQPAAMARAPPAGAEVGSRARCRPS